MTDTQGIKVLTILLLIEVIWLINNYNRNQMEAEANFIIISKRGADQEVLRKTLNEILSGEYIIKKVGDLIFRLLQFDIPRQKQFFYLGYLFFFWPLHI